MALAVFLVVFVLPLGPGLKFCNHSQDSIIKQYNLHEPCRPIRALEIFKDRQQTTDKQHTSNWILGPGPIFHIGPGQKQRPYWTLVLGS